MSACCLLIFPAHRNQGCASGSGLGAAGLAGGLALPAMPSQLPYLNSAEMMMELHKRLTDEVRHANLTFAGLAAAVGLPG